MPMLAAAVRPDLIGGLRPAARNALNLELARADPGIDVFSTRSRVTRGNPDGT